MMRTNKTGPGTAADAAAVAPAAHLSIPSLPAAVMQLMTGQYMMFADKELSAGSLQEKVGNNYVNIGVIAALALSMVGIAPGDVGDSLVESSNGSVTLETCQHDMHMYMHMHMHMYMSTPSCSVVPLSC